MKRSILLLVVFLFSSVAQCFAQQTETFDIATFQPPKGWQRQAGADGVQFSIEDKATGAFSLITLFRSVPSLGESKENFDASWRTIVKETVNVTGDPTMQPSADPQGWKLEMGSAPFEKDGAKGVVFLFNVSGFGKMLNVMALTNTQAHGDAITAFVESVSLKKPVVESVKATPAGQAVRPQSARKGEFKFTENRFNDGWTAIEQEDWVRVTKGSSTVLIHYALPDIRGFNNLDEASASVWNNMVAPRYSDLKNFFSRRSWYADGDFMNGNILSRAT